MGKLFFPSAIFFLLLSGIELPAQNLRFKTVLDNPNSFLVDMKQDKLGFFWLNNTARGLQKFDGVKVQTFSHDPDNPNSIAPGQIISMVVDADNIIWLGMAGSGLDRLDPSTNTFTHFRHNERDAFSLSDDTVNTVLEDHAGNLWVGTNQGLDLLDRKTGRFTRCKNDQDEKRSTNSPQVTRIFEDRKGVLWICGRTSSKKHISPSALNRFDPAAKKFTPYMLDSAKANNGIPGTWVSDIYEDNKNNFWIVTDAGLYTMDRNTGKSTRYYPDPFHSGPLSQVPVTGQEAKEVIFVTEDSSGAFWVGMGQNGLNRYDPVTKQSMHFGLQYDFLDLSASIEKDSITGLNIPFAFKGVSSEDGLFWVLGLGGISQLNYKEKTIPFYNISKAALAIYLEANDKNLWIGTNKGLLKKEISAQHEKLFVLNPKDNGRRSKFVFSITADEEENLWLGTGGGLVKFDPITEKYLHYKNDPKNSSSISSNNVFYSFFDHDRNLWLATDSGISRLDKATGQFTNYNRRQIGANFNGFEINRIAEDTQHDIWFTTNWGLYKLDIKTGKFRRYLVDDLRSLYVDDKGSLWVGGWMGLYLFDKAKDKFEFFGDDESALRSNGVLDIIEDNQHNLWVSTTTTIFRINERRDKIEKYTQDNGVKLTQSLWSHSSFEAADGGLYLGNYFGYYSFYPDQLTDSIAAPPLHITGFTLDDKRISAANANVLSLPIWQSREIKLAYNQNVFSFEFFLADYIAPAEKRYSYMLENYDASWHDIKSENRASFFNIPPGSYVFRVKAVSGDGNAVEKSIRIIVSPPWWETWWFRGLSVLALIAVIYGVIKERSRKLVAEKLQLEQKVAERTAQLEKSLVELKSAQAQLIQSEKMASLGELTAGIAHEIQNPLNFVNNFSDLSKELLLEMKEEMDIGNAAEAKAIADDLVQNLDKILHHGKRADAIVKGMLQHSRTAADQKDETDINALCDEYLRLAYHGYRAKDNAFHVKLETDFDPGVGKVSVIQQDIGRVLLNLYNNAFYAVAEKAGSAGPDYIPTVTVRTNKQVKGGKAIVEIAVSDNGCGIPDKIREKIFQPFFTTKPTGQGTGLGLSLSYDIIKAHGGTLNVDSIEGEGSTFIINLPTRPA
jgi:signal transduction histidine kinase/ligand-binding sensor domain-containing protein